MPRVLLLEDDPDVRVLMEHVLIGDRYQVDAAATVAAARVLLSERDYDVVLVDGVLPDGIGIEIAERAERQGISAIIVTAYAFIMASEAMARFDLLLKPVRPDELLKAVRRVLDRRSTTTSSRSI